MSDIKFDEIIPFFNGDGDSGKTARIKINGNFDKIKTWLDGFSNIDELFEKVNLGTADAPNYAIHAKFSLYSESGLTAYGKGNAGAGGSGGLDEALLWSILGNTGDEQIVANHLATALSPYALVAALPTKVSQLNNDMGFVTASIVNGYATEFWCNSAFAAAAHTHNYLSKLVIGATSYDVASNTITIPAYPTTLPASDVYAWAKASAKPNYAFSEIVSKPTTLNGYGITDIANASVNHAANADKLNGFTSSNASLPIDANAALSNGLYYYTANGPTGMTTSDGGLYVQNYSTEWGGQIAQDYRNGRLAVRGRNSNSWTTWLHVLDEANYNSYVPSLTGGGASGNWGINAQHLLINNATWASDWYWDGQGGQPTWLWGSNDGFNMRVWNPANFSVASATRWQTARNIWGVYCDGTGDANGIFRSLLNDSANGSVVHKILNYTSSPYGLETRIYNTGAVSLQSQRESNDGETFPLILNPNGGNVGISTTSPQYKLDVIGEIRASGWLRQTGTAGWYNESYGGGIYMQDSSWVRVYNGKGFRAENTISATRFECDNEIALSNHTTGNYGLYATIADNDGWYIQGEAVSSNSSGLRIGTYDDSNEYIAVSQGPSRTSYTRTAYLLDASGNTSFPGTMTAGNVLSTGGVTAYTTSDKRLKENIAKIDSLQNIRSLGGIYQFDYKQDGRHSVGLIAQNVQASIFPDMVFKRDNGYFAVNYLDPRLVSLALGAVIQVDDEVTALKKRVRKLENRIKNLIIQ